MRKRSVGATARASRRISAWRALKGSGGAYGSRAVNDGVREVRRSWSPRQPPRPPQIEHSGRGRAASGLVAPSSAAEPPKRKGKPSSLTPRPSSRTNREFRSFGACSRERLLLFWCILEVEGASPRQPHPEARGNRAQHRPDRGPGQSRPFGPDARPRPGARAQERSCALTLLKTSGPGLGSHGLPRTSSKYF